MKTPTLTPSRRARKDLNVRRLAALTRRSGTPTVEERIWVEANRLCAVAVRPSTPLRERRNALEDAALMRAVASFLATHTNSRHHEP